MSRKEVVSKKKSQASKEGIFSFSGSKPETEALRSMIHEGRERERGCAQHFPQSEP